MDQLPPTLDQTWMDASLLDELAAHPAGATLRVAPAAGPAHGEPPSTPPDAGAQGLVLGERIGSGGFADVFSATQPALDRTVAVKRVRQLRGDLALQIFLHEARITAGLTHPNILPVHDLVRLDGHPALVMKRVEGESWAHHLEAARGEGRFDLPTEIARLRDVARATGFAHSRGVLHLDIKPSNVMLGDFDETLLMDWGCAVLLDSAMGKVQPAFSLARQVRSPRGTPLYMAPEVARGDGGALSEASDVYLLGALLYTLLTPGAFRTGDTTLEILDRACSGAVPTLSPSLDPVLRALCAEALDPDPTTRLASAVAFGARLQRWLDTRDSRLQTERGLARLGQLAAAGELSPEQQRDAVALLGVFEQAGRGGAGLEVATRAEWRTRRLLASHALRQREPGLARAFALPLPAGDAFRQSVLARADVAQRRERRMARTLRAVVAVTVVLVLIGVGSVAYYQAQAAQERIRVEGQQALSTELLRSVRTSGEQGLDVARFLRVLDEADGEISQHYAGRPLLQAELWTAMGDAYRGLDEDERAETYLRRALDLLEGAQGPTHPATVDAIEKLAQFYQSQRRLGEASRLLEGMLARLEDAHGPDSDEVLQGRYRVADLRRGQGRYDDAIAILEENLARQRERLGPDHPDTLSTLALLGRTHLDAERPEPAGPLLLRAHQGRQRALGPSHADTLGSAHLLALWYRRVGQREESVALLQELVALRESTIGFEDGKTLSTAHNLALGLYGLGRYTEARALLERVLVQYERLEGPHGFETQIARSNLGLTLRALGATEEAEAALRRSREIRVAELGDRAPKTLISTYFLAETLLEQGDAAAAAPLAAHLQAVAPEVFGPTHGNTIEMQALWARVLAAQGSAVEAQARAQALLAEAERTYGPDDPVTHTCLAALVAVYREVGAHDRAREAAERLLAARVEDLGVDHPRTLKTVVQFAASLDAAGEPEAARALEARWLQDVDAALGGEAPRREQERWLDRLRRDGAPGATP